MAPRGPVIPPRHLRRRVMARIPPESLTGALRAPMSPTTSPPPPRGRVIVMSAAAAHRPRHSPAIPSTHRAHPRRHTPGNNMRIVECNTRRNNTAILPPILRSTCVLTVLYLRRIPALLAPVQPPYPAPTLRIASGTLASSIRTNSVCHARRMRHIKRRRCACLAHVTRTSDAVRAVLQRECDAILAPMYPLTLHSYRAAPARELRPHSAAKAAFSPAGSPS